MSASAAALLALLLEPPPAPLRSGVCPQPAARRMRPSTNALRIAVLLLLWPYSTISVEKRKTLLRGTFGNFGNFRGARRIALLIDGDGQQLERHRSDPGPELR